MDYLFGKTPLFRKYKKPKPPKGGVVTKEQNPMHEKIINIMRRNQKWQTKK